MQNLKCKNNNLWFNGGVLCGTISWPGTVTYWSLSWLPGLDYKTPWSHSAQLKNSPTDNPAGSTGRQIFFGQSQTSCFLLFPVFVVNGANRLLAEVSYLPYRHDKWYQSAHRSLGQESKSAFFPRCRSISLNDCSTFTVFSFADLYILTCLLVQSSHTNQPYITTPFLTFASCPSSHLRLTVESR